MRERERERKRERERERERERDLKGAWNFRAKCKIFSIFGTVRNYNRT